MEKKGWHNHSLNERGPRPLPGQAFIDFLGTLHQECSSFTMHRFAVCGYLLQITKERKLLLQRERIFANAKEKLVELVTLHTWEV